ncbi:DUF3592 domain-containing protein [Kitasatospora sp. MAP5-34]|uniref:DUF3592 domain-containing protein n=1 Tax=Kitasatospora sp. MAP5-34 TaxID=3035102 RepID=UPI002475FCFE|nr:DUF3592 domain-containing protein [Kitasatospora sp. MAP5-34]MDH6580555.1 hypothetical protein [Kitasatospora sp. MAP5-34]
MGVTMLLPVALFGLLGGAVAYLAGAAGLRESRRLRSLGVPVQALVRYRAPDPGDRTAAARPLLQFVTANGRVMEVFSPVPSTRAHTLVDGRRIPLRYDPADPRQVQVPGRERLGLEYAFLALGVAAALVALVVAVLALRPGG